MKDVIHEKKKLVLLFRIPRPDEMERLNQQAYDPFICIWMTVENERAVINAMPLIMSTTLFKSQAKASYDSPETIEKADIRGP